MKPLRKKPDPNAYFLLGRVYFLMEDYYNAYETFNKMLDFKKELSEEQKDKLDEFIIESARFMQSE